MMHNDSEIIIIDTRNLAKNVFISKKKDDATNLSQPVRSLEASQFFQWEAIDQPLCRALRPPLMRVTPRMGGDNEFL